MASLERNQRSQVELSAYSAQNLKGRYVSVELPLGHLLAVLVPLGLFITQEKVEHMLVVIVNSKHILEMCFLVINNRNAEDVYKLHILHLPTINNIS